MTAYLYVKKKYQLNKIFMSLGKTIFPFISTPTKSREQVINLFTHNQEKINLFAFQMKFMSTNVAATYSNKMNFINYLSLFSF